MDKKRKGASRTQGVEVKVSPVGALPRELCQAPGFISKDLLQRWENPGDFSSHSQISGFQPLLAPLGFGHIHHALTVTFSCALCQVLANLAAHTLSCRWCGPCHESFDCRPGLRGPCTQFLPKAAAFSVGQMGLVVVVQGMVTFFGGQVYKDRVKVLSR